MNTRALQKLGYGMYVITSKSGDSVNGQIANTVFQITSEPPTIAVSLNKKNLTWELVNGSRTFAVSVLSQDTPLSFIGHFGFKSGREIDKLEGIGYRTGLSGIPVVTDHAVSYLEAEVVGQLDLGTHTVFIGKVTEADMLNEKACMTYDYYHQVKRGTTPATAPSYVSESKEVRKEMTKYKCSVCGWVYDPEIGDKEAGIAPGTPFEALPDDWACPMCGAGKSEFEKV